jgi:FkbM family methyltransferase
MVNMVRLDQHPRQASSRLAFWTTGIVRLWKIILVERRLPGRCYQLYYSFLNSLGIRFATVKAKNGFIIKGYTHCFFMFYEIWSKRDYDIPDFAFTKKATVIDVGANQGFFSLYAASQGASVYAFEPCAENFKVLRWNVAKNGLENQVKAFNMAVTGKKGHVPLYVGLDGSGGILSGTASVRNENRGGEGVQVRSVECTSLDSLLQDLHIERCDFLKMDCEGAEYEILKNTSGDSFRKIVRISIECHENRMAEAVAVLKSAGFEILSQRAGEAGILKAAKMQKDG